MGNSFSWIELISGGILITIGVVAIIRRRFVFRARWFLDHYSVKLNGRAALIFGIFQVIGGTLLAFGFLFHWLGNTFSSELLHSLPWLGFTISGATIGAASYSNPALLDRYSDLQEPQDLSSIYPWIRKSDVDQRKEERITVVDREARMNIDLDENQNI